MIRGCGIRKGATPSAIMLMMGVCVCVCVCVCGVCVCVCVSQGSAMSDSQLVSSGFRLFRPILKKLCPCSPWDFAGDLGGGGGRGSDAPSALFLDSGELGGFFDFEDEEEEVPDSSLEGCDVREGSPNILSQSSICVGHCTYV